MELWGHVEGMLDRDQRTAKIFNLQRHVVPVHNYEGAPLIKNAIAKQNKVISHSSSVPERTSPYSSCKTRKNGHFWKSLHRLKHALIVGTYLSLVTFPSILSAPTLRNSMSSRRNTEPKWLNPCGMGAVNGGGDAEKHSISDEQLLNQIIHQANIARSRALLFKEDYVHKTFNMDSDQLHNLYKDIDYDWLPTKSIPKKLKEPVDPEHLESLELEITLLKVYEYLQILAVGLEQVVWDQEDTNGQFKASFAETENYLRTLLCEIQTAIIEKNITMWPDKTREVMIDEFRTNMDNTSMNIRNWIIYRDYLNMLEYILEVFKHFQTKLPTMV